MTDPQVPLEATSQNALPAGSLLMEYRLTQVLGAGAFGVTYLARDQNLDKDVAIKEFAPGGIATRAVNGDVVPTAAEQTALFRWGRDRFIQEARTLAAISHPSIVRVNRYFEAHGTAYMVMDYERGETFKSFVQGRGRIAEAELKSLLAPLLDGLERVHAAGYLHRDIKPDNILVRQSGELVLLDFGSARRAVPGASQGLTALVSPGYAPIEQYSEAHAQGAWSDVYALGGVLYFAVTGQRPPDSLARMKGDSGLPSLQQARQNYSAPFIDAIAWALAWDDTQRPRSVEAWRGALFARTADAKGMIAAVVSDQEATVRIGSSPTSLDDATVRIDDLSRARTSPVQAASEPSSVAATPATDRAQPSPHDGNWTWVAGYLILAVGAALLGVGLASTELFATTSIVGSRSWLEEVFDRPGRQILTAAQIAKATGYIIAIAVLWALALKAARRLRDSGGRVASWAGLLLPAATLIASAGAYSALLPVANALPQSSAVFKWFFVVASAAAGVWLVLTIATSFEELARSKNGTARSPRSSADATRQKPTAD